MVIQRKRSKQDRQQKRKSAIDDPELTLEKRRIRVSRISDPVLQCLEIEHIGGIALSPVSQQTNSTSTILFHVIKDLKCFKNFDYSIYLRACESKNYYSLVTVIPYDIKTHWICYCCSEKFKRNKRNVNKDECLRVNLLSDLNCTRCDSECTIGKMRPFFVDLQRLSFSIRDRHEVFLKRIKSLDDELFRCFEAIKSIESIDEMAFPLDIRDTVKTLTSIDLDLVQNEVLQRVEIKATKQILKNLVKQKKMVILRLWEECVMVTQIISNMAVVHIQRYVRGFIPRRRIGQVRMVFIQRKQRSAAIDIQSKVRSWVTQKRFHQKLYGRKIESVVVIQCFFRQRLAMKVLNYLAAENEENLQKLAAVMIQMTTRGFISRRDFARLLQLKQDEIAEQSRVRAGQIINSAAIMIQTRFRIHISRQVLQSLYLDQRLHPRIRYHANKFLKAGHLWSFLFYLSEDYRRYENQIDEILCEEEANAKTFINEITKVRETELKKAWAQYREATHMKYYSKQNYDASNSSIKNHTFPFINEALQCDLLQEPSSCVNPRLHQCVKLKLESPYSEDNYKSYLKGKGNARKYNKFTSMDCSNAKLCSSESRSSYDRDVCQYFGHRLQLNGSIRNPYSGEHLSSIRTDSLEEKNKRWDWINKYSSKIIMSKATECYLENRRAPRVFFD